MSIVRLFEDYGVPHVLRGEHQHATRGWINVHCPFCGPANYHMGISEDGTACHCWRCGSRPRIEVFSALLNLPISETREILREYAAAPLSPVRKNAEAKIRVRPFRFPQPSGALDTLHQDYLHRRGFDPERLERKWGLLGTGPVSFLDKISYAHRIIAPIRWKGEIVSFQARDITNRSRTKYLACPAERETVHHKDILYGKPEFWESAEALIIVEGITDAWRLGSIALATFGIEFKTEQALEIARIGDKRFFIIYDNEPQAQEQARKLAVKLRALGRKAYLHTVDSDPGDLSPADARYLVKEINRNLPIGV